MRPFRPRSALVLLVFHSCLAGRALAQSPDAAAPPPVEDEAAVDEERAPADEDVPSDAELEAEMNRELAAEEAASAQALVKPPAQGKGALVGVVTDTKFNESIIEATVTVIGTKVRTFTDVDGRFRLELPPGTYDVRISYELHQPARVGQVVVEAGKVARVDVQLVPDESAIETVEVVADADKTSLEGQTLERRRSASVGDGVGRAEIAKTPDRNAAEAAQRVVGATIVGARFVYVRGLGERYTNALLNGTPLPSPEPDRQTVPLDLFPALVLDSITINKTFTPDMPADFAGGSVRINTRDFPRQTLFQISLTGGFNDRATFNDRFTYTGSSTDWLGYDGGTRRLPSEIPDKRLDANSAVNGERLTSDEELTRYGRSINSRMSSRRHSTAPNHGLSIVAGDSFKLGGQQKLGVVAALNYGRSYQIVNQSIQNFRSNSGGGFSLADRITSESGIESVRWGAFGSVSYEPVSDHRVNLTVLRSQSSDDEALELEGSYENSASVIHTTHLQFTERSLNFGQLRGNHTFRGLNRLQIDWYAALSGASREQPDTRDNNHVKTATGYTWSQGPTSGSHFFSSQSETSKNGGLDLTQPLTTDLEQETKLKAGGLVSSRDRDFSARRFVLEPVPGRGRLDVATLDRLGSCAGTSYSLACSDALFTSSSVRPDLLTLRESTQTFDRYEAGLDIWAGYAMLDSQLTRTLRAIGGVRVEHTKQAFAGFDPFDRARTERRANLDSTDILPALSVVFAPSTKSSTRFAVSQTLARPQLREIAPFLSSSYTGTLPVQGNPDLELTKITNADVRFEYFPSLREVLAFSVFYKHFQQPIEETISRGAQSGIITYENAASADLIGLELEGRKNLGFINGALRDFSVIANVTAAKSRVSLPEGTFATNASRPLSFQSPYIFNVSLDYGNSATGTDIRLLYNVYGRRIVTVGMGGLPDVYEQPRNVIDLTFAQKIAKHFELKLAAQNLLRTDGVFTQGTDIRDDDANVTRRYTTARLVTLTGTYTY